MARFAMVVLALVSFSAMNGCAGNSTDGNFPTVAKKALENAEQFELFSLDPPYPNDAPFETGVPTFHRWKVLGKVEIADRNTRQRIVAALRKGVAEMNIKSVPGCFSPRHGIRAIRGGKSIDFVICFECWQVEMYAGEQHLTGFLTTGSPQPVFDAALKDAGVPLAQKPKR